MPRLSQAQRAARQSILDLAASNLAPEPLANRFAAALLGAIPADGFRVFGVDPGSLLINRLLAASDSDAWARAEWLREVYLQSGDFSHIELPMLMQAGLTAVASHETRETCWGYTPRLLERLSPAEHRRLFHELRSPVGGTILACFPSDGRWVGAMQAYRRDPNRPFRAGDVGFVRSVAPIIGGALAAALRVEHASIAASVEPEPSGIVVVGPGGDVRFATPAGESWSREIGDVGDRSGGLLPTAAWAAVARLRENGGRAAAVIVPSRRGRVRVEASPAGADGSLAIIFAPERPPVLPESPADWPLTPAERRVTDLVLRGFSNARIAEAAFISVNTVEWHLRAVYEKAGVRNRAGLLAKLFADTAPPDLLEGGPARA